ncbi:MAG: family 10 glycosylhydrolase [Runella sp.]
MKKILFWLLISTSLFAQPKREFRAMWIANVGNVDWPSTKGLSAQQQQTELIELLDMAQRQGLNAVFFQIRNACDAVYESRLEPWSEWLTGQQGQSPGYDPLAFIVRECRKRNLEIHAWLNPYRAVTDIRTASLASNHVARVRPDVLLSYGNLRILDPGLPEVRAFVTRVVMDVTRRYDIDGIHFDDYFYPYPQQGLTLNDNATFAEHSRGFSNRADWRRDNVNLLIKTVADSIKNTKPWVKFGVSPFGIWQNRSSSPLGSNTNGFESYSGIYADSRKWVAEGWLDYILPQVYWSIGNSSANFAELLPWWNQNAGDVHLYIGHGAYKINTDSDTRWRNPREIPEQVRLARTYSNVKGSTFFSAKTLRNNPNGVGDSLENGVYSNIALIPPMPWKDQVSPYTPTRIAAKLNDNNTITLSWTYPYAPVSEMDKARYFVIYRGTDQEPIEFRSGKSIWGTVMKAEGTTSFTIIDRDVEAGIKYSYAITAVDRLHNESSPTEIVSPSVLTSTQTPPPIATTPTTPPAEETPPSTDLQVFPNPFNQQISIRYRLTSASEVSLYVYDERGTRVGVLVDKQMQEAGNYSVQFNGQFLSEGVYFARLMAGNTPKTAKMILKR